MTVVFVECPDPALPNGHSLLAAAPHAGTRFYLQMVDHVFGAPALGLLDRDGLADGVEARLLVDPSPAPSIDVEDATRVVLEGSQIRAIGKGIAPWHAIDTGCFLLTQAVFEALRAVPEAEPKTVSSAMRQLAARGALWATPIEDVAWADVDTPADRRLAEQLLMRASSRLVQLT
jgi:choline kinase